MHPDERGYLSHELASEAAGNYTFSDNRQVLEDMLFEFFLVVFFDLALLLKFARANLFLEFVLHLGNEIIDKSRHEGHL